MTNASTYHLNLLFDDDTRIKNLWDDDEYLYLEKIVANGCFPIDLEKIAAKNNRFIDDEVEKCRRRRQASSRHGSETEAQDSSSLCRLPLVGPCVKTLRIQRERREKVKTLTAASGRRIRVFEYGKRRLTTSDDSPISAAEINPEVIYAGSILGKNDRSSEKVAVKKILSRNRNHLRLLLREVREKEECARFYSNRGLSVRGIIDHAVDDKTLALYVVLPLFDCTLEDVVIGGKSSISLSSSSNSSVSSSRSSFKRDYEILIEDELSPTGFSIDWPVYRRWCAEKVKETLTRAEMIGDVISAVDDLQMAAKGRCDPLQPLRLNPSNVFFTWDKEKGTSSLFLGDFDLASSLENERLPTELFMAPEMGTNSQKLSRLDVFASNVWSAGVLIFWILSGGLHPHADVTCNIPKAELTLMNISRDFPSALLRYDDEMAKNLLSAMVSKDPGSRPSISATKQHPFFADVETLVSFMLDLNEIMTEKSVPVDLKVKFEEGASFVLSKRGNRDYDDRSHSTTTTGPYSCSFLDQITSSKEAKLDVLVRLFDSLRGCHSAADSEDYSPSIREDILRLIDSEFPLFIIHSLSFAVYHLKEYLSLFSSTRRLDLHSFDLLEPFARAYYRYLKFVSRDGALYERLKTKRNYPIRWIIGANERGMSDGPTVDESDSASNSKLSEDKVPDENCPSHLHNAVPAIPAKSKLLPLSERDEREIRGQPWFFADLKRDQAEKILSLPHNLFGTYLVRRSESEERQLSLSVTFAGGNGANVVLHYRIFKGIRGFRVYRHCFVNVLELIRYYHENEIMDEHYRSVKLTYPCLKRQ